ncbi:MAG: carbohydrate ABC transporter permease [Candidatus Humimicrobiaceae bacterium]
MKKYSFAFIFILPTILYLLIFQIYPLFESVRLSFTDLSFIRPGSGKYIGLTNYINLLTNDKDFWKIISNSFIWVFGSTFLQYTFAIPAAMILNQKLIARPVWRGFMMVPWVIPTVVMALIWKWIYDGDYGLLNYYLHSHITWLGNDQTVWPALLLASTWKGLPFATLMLLAGLQGIPKDLYEAAEVDGCNKFREFIYIMIPMLAPVLFVSALISIVQSWTKFEVVYLLTGGGPGYTTSVLPTYIYTKSMVFFEMGEGSAVATISMLFMLIFVLIYLKLFQTRD